MPFLWPPAGHNIGFPAFTSSNSILLILQNQSASENVFLLKAESFPKHWLVSGSHDWIVNNLGFPLCSVLHYLSPFPRSHSFIKMVPSQWEHHCFLLGADVDAKSYCWYSTIPLCSSLWWWVNGRTMAVVFREATRGGYIAELIRVFNISKALYHLWWIGPIGKSSAQVIQMNN